MAVSLTDTKYTQRHYEQKKNVSPEKNFSTHCAPTCMKTHCGQGSTRVSLLPLTFRPYTHTHSSPREKKELWAYGVAARPLFRKQGK